MPLPLDQLRYPPCKNPNCKNYGHSHPNCRCYTRVSEQGMADRGYMVPGSTAGLTMKANGKFPKVSMPSRGSGGISKRGYAHGGEVMHHCISMQPHHESCEYFATGGEIQDNQEFAQNPNLAIDHAAVTHGLLHLLTKTGHSKSENPNKTAEDFLASSKQGKKALHSHLTSHFEKKHSMAHDPSHVMALKSHLQSIQENPSQLLEGGGDLHNSLPDHAMALGAKTAQAVNYLQSIKPMNQQNAPLDEISPPGKGKDAQYDRQLELAENPMHILELAKSGQIQPVDLQTINAIYPALGRSIKEGITEALVTAKVDGKEIPYKHRMGLSAILGQPIDSTQSPQAMRAIIASQPGLPPPQAPTPKKRNSSGASTQTQKTIAKVDNLYKNPIEARLTDRRS